jgi:hypothetical protein
MNMPSTERLDIVNLIESNPIARLNRTYQNKFIQKVQEKFSETQQQLFIGSFYCYLNYEKNDFVIDLENVWKWLDFSRKDPAKVVLEKHFVKDIDYIVFQQPLENPKMGGRPKEIILMNINTFKKLCLKSNTKKADEIHDYFIKLEETFQEIVNEESTELKQQLEKKNKIIENNQLFREKTILEQFPDNKQCVYYGIIDDKSNTGENLIKFGNSNKLNQRIDQHKKTYTNFRLINAFEVKNKIQIENAIKKNPIINMKRRTISLNKINYNELLAVNDLSFEQIDNIIKEIINNEEITIEKLLRENQELKTKNAEIIQENERLKDVISKGNINDEVKIQNLLLSEENEKLKAENKKIIRKRIEKLPELNQVMTNLISITPQTNNNEEIESEVINDLSYENIANSYKRISKSEDGFYYINNKKYSSCFGTREEVWNETAFKTTGGLTKEQFIMNRYGKIVSKSKFIESKTNYRFTESNKKRVKNLELQKEEKNRIIEQNYQ